MTDTEKLKAVDKVLDNFMSWYEDVPNTYDDITQDNYTVNIKFVFDKIIDPLINVVRDE